MTCQECELALAGEDRVSSLEEHLASCAACREFALELGANSEAMLAFAAEAMPAAPRIKPRRQQVGWWAAVAAMLVLGFVSSWAILRPTREPARVSPPVPLLATVETQVPSLERPPVRLPVKRHVARQSPQRSEPKILQIKMLTDDPDVVIYWQIEN
jgi:hypothetical protein